jgi:tetratricopeptide (TPR) repeat protein
MTNQFLPRCLIGLALSSAMFAQGVKPSTPGGSGSAPSAPPIGNVPSTTTNQQDFSQHPLFLSGKVEMEDGTAPSDAATIQLVCHSSPRTIGRTDVRGGFSVDLNNRAAMNTMSDASESGSPGSSGGPVGAPTNGFSSAVAAASGNPAPQGVTGRDLMGCDLQATLPGFRSEVLHLSNRRVMDDPNVGVILMHRVANVQGTTVSATSAMAPKDAQKAREKGQNAIRKDDLDEAQKQFQKAVEIYPRYAVAWVELGRLQEHKDDLEGARKSFMMAVQSDDKLVTPYLSLASLALREKKWQEVADQTDHVLNLNPVDFPQAYLYSAIGNFYLKKLDIAEKSAREGLNHDPEHRFPGIYAVLGAVLEQKQDYQGAAEQFRACLRYSPENSDTSMARKQLAAIEKYLSPEAKKQ